MIGLFKRLKALENRVQEMEDSKYRIVLDDGTEKLLNPSDAILAYAPYIKAVHIGPRAQNMTQMLLLISELFGRRDYYTIRFYDHEGKDITREMQQAFRDRGLAG